MTTIPTTAITPTTPTTGSAGLRSMARTPVAPVGPIGRQPRSRRRAWSAIAIAAVAVGVAACGSSSSTSTTTTQSAPTTTGGSTSTTGGSTSTTGGSTSTTGGSTSTTSGSTSCATSSLAISVGSPDGTAGAVHYQITFKNTGSASCTLYGYPGVSFLTAGGSQIGAPAVRPSSGSVTTVTLPAGGSAYSSVAVTDPGIPPCTGSATATQVRVYPPGQTQAALVTAPSGMLVCSSPNTSAYSSAEVSPVSATAL